MQQTIERPTGRSRPGLLRRLLVRDSGKRTEPAPVPPEPPVAPTTIVDLPGGAPADQWRAAVSEQLERLETGISLVAETMKRAFARVFLSIEDHSGTMTPRDELARLLEDSLSSLEPAMEDLAESIRQVPYVLAAAAHDVSVQLEAACSRLRDGDLSFQPSPPVPDPSAQPELLPAAPFELEPIEEQFATMDDT